MGRQSVVPETVERLMITQEKLQSLLRYDADTGTFEWKEMRSGIKNFPIAGSIHKTYGYLVICIDQKRYQAHRLAWLYVNGVTPPDLIDHIDGNRLNNCIVNLRLATMSENLQNRKGPAANNKLGFIGASFDKRDSRWTAWIKANGKSRYLGRYATGEEASQVYLMAKRELHPFNTL